MVGAIGAGGENVMEDDETEHPPIIIVRLLSLADGSDRSENEYDKEYHETKVSP